MSKKRTKSPANNVANNKWESNIVSAELNEGQWSYSMLLLVENIFEDKETIDYIRKGIQTGLRRKFSLLNSERLNEMVMEYGGGKGKKGKDAPPNFEVCEHAKTYLDRGEKIPASVIARLIKWSMLTAKIDDTKEKVDGGKKSDGKGSKSKKPAEKPDRSKSSAGKKGAQAAGKKSPEPPSVKGDTKLRKRGDPDPDIQFIDDEPDDGSSRYFVVTGLPDPAVIEALAEIGCIVTSIVKVTRDIHISNEDTENNGKEAEKTSDELPKKEEIDTEIEKQSEALNTFWTKIPGILNNNKNLFNTPIVTLVAKHLMFPVDKEDVDQQHKCSMDLFESVAVLTYDLLDLKRQWKNYLEKSKLIELPVKHSDEVKTEMVAIESARDEKPPSEEAPTKLDCISAVTFDKVDMDYYRYLLQAVPLEETSVFLQMSAMLDQIDVTNGEMSADWNQPKLSSQEGISDEAATMLHELVNKLYLSKEDVQDLRESLKLTAIESDGQTNDTEVPIHALDGISLRSVQIKSNNLGKEGSMIRELRMLIKGFQQIDLLHSVPVDDLVAKRRAARLQEFLKYIDNTGLSKIEINYAIKMFILESLVVSGTDENGIIRVNDQEGVFPKNLNQTWDDPFIILDDVGQSIIDEEHGLRSTKVEMYEESSDSVVDDASISGRSSSHSTEGILKPSRSLSRSPDGQRSSRRKSSVHFIEVDSNEIASCVTEAELYIAGMLSDDANDSLQSILLDYLQNVRKRSFTEWCFEEFYEPHVLLQIIQEAFYRLPFLDIYSERKSNGKIVVLHNPFQEKLRYNHQAWNQWLHANVGFRNYLDFITDKITDWTRDQEAIYQALLLSKELENSDNPKEEESPKPNLKKSVDKGKKPIKSKSRSRSASRSSSADETDNKELQFVLPGSLKALKMEQDKILKAKEEEERKKEEKRSLSSQKKAEKDAAKDKVKRPSSKASNKSKTKRSVIEDSQDQAQLLVVEPINDEPEEYWPFIGYDLGDNLAHFSGEVAHLFPSDGCTMRIQRTQKLLDSTSVRVSIITPQSHVFSLHVIDPLLSNEDQVDNFEKVLEQLENQSNISRYGASTCVFNDGLCLAASNHGYSGSPDQINRKSLDKDQLVEVVNNYSGRSEDNSGDARTNSGPNPANADNNRRSTSPRNVKRDNVDLRDLQNIILTTPNGVQIRIGYELDVTGERKLLMYLTTNEGQSSNGLKKEKLQVVKEIGRYIMSDGKVISILNNNTIKVMFPDGTLATTTLNEETVVTRQEETDESKIEKANIRETPSQKKKKQSKVPAPDQPVVADPNTVIEDRKEIIDKIRYWTVTRPSGEVFETKANLNVFDLGEPLSKLPNNNTADDVEDHDDSNNPDMPQWKKYISNASQKDSLLISCATDPATGETLVTRSDGTLLLTTQDAGIFLSEHLDRTRFTKYFHLDKTALIKEPDESNIIEIIQIESENYPVITIDRTNKKIETRCGSMCSIISEPDGSHYYKHSDGTEIEYRSDGEIIFTAACNSQMSYLQPYGLSSYVLNAMSNVICELLDSDGSEFIVNASGNYEVNRNVKDISKSISTNAAHEADQNAPKPTSAISGASDTDRNGDDNSIRKFDQHAPRIFFLNADGSGSELLRYRDIVDTIVSAEVDGEYFQYKESVQDHPHIIGHTIIHPIPKTKPWQYDYSRKTVLPKGLTCRDMKTFPSVETVKPGPLFAMSIGKGLSIGTNPMKVEIGKKTSENTKTIKSSDALQFRQFYHYPLISDDVRQSFDSQLVEYNKSVLRQRQRYKDLEVFDDRTEAEQTNAEEVRNRFINMGTVNGQILNNAIHALSEDIQSSKVQNDINLKAKELCYDLGSKANRKRLDILLEKEKIEKEKEIENKRALKYQLVPNYFTSVYGKDFLTNQAVDLKTLNKSMKLFPVSREGTARNGYPTDADTELVVDKSVLSPNIDQDKVIDLLKNQETTKVSQSSNNQTDKGDIIFKKKERKYIYYDSSLIIPSLPKRKPISTDLPLPRYLYSQRPFVEQNIKQATVEDPVRRKQLMTSLIGGPVIGQIFQRQCRGLNVLPSRIDTGLLREGGRYTFKIKMINTGPESSFFKIKQPPSTSGIWVEFVPGPIPAGLSRTIIVHIYAIAKSLESSDSSVFVIEHPLKVVTDTDILEIPITGRVMTADKYDLIYPSNKILEIGLPAITESLPAIKSEN